MYRGRLAPTPSGELHLGHAYTFLWAAQCAVQAQGQLVLRMEDLDLQRCNLAFAQGIIEDLQWLEIDWQEGPDVGGIYGPYNQSERLPIYLKGWQQLRDAGAIYPCTRSRKDLLEELGAPHEEGVNERVFPVEWRPKLGVEMNYKQPRGVNWRFRVPVGRKITFMDGFQGVQCFEAGKDFGDFLVWRRDDVPAYELATPLDDAAMGITEVVRGADLLKSTARQYLIYEALGFSKIPTFHHTPLVCDEVGKRLAKRDRAMSLRALRASGHTATTLRQGFDLFKQKSRSAE